MVIVDDTNDAAARNKEAAKRIKELREINDKDKDFVRTTADSYEMLVGDAVGIGDLFNQVEDDENA